MSCVYSYIASNCSYTLTVVTNRSLPIEMCRLLDHQNISCQYAYCYRISNRYNIPRELIKVLIIMYAKLIIFI